MSVPQSVKDELNRQLHERVRGQTGTAPDYMRDKATFERDIVSEIARAGWELMPMDARGETVALDQAQSIHAKRVTTVTVTRSARRQARLVELGQVQPENNMYTYPHTENMRGSLGEVRETRDGPVVWTNDEPLVLAAALAASLELQRTTSVVEPE